MLMIMISVFNGWTITGITPEQKNTERRKPGTIIGIENMLRSILTWLKNWPSIKNPQFLSNPNETLGKWLSQELIIFNKFHEDRTKMGIFYQWPIFERVSFFLLRLYLWSILTCHQKLGSGRAKTGPWGAT